ncbi:MAG: hypothetical protein RIQ89_395 [Bacteroidota bacterium]|jgi:Fe-S-cluster containining protein
MPAYKPLKDLKPQFKKRKKIFNTFLKGIYKRKYRGKDALAIKSNKEAFEVIDCLKCANCCKTMTPTWKKSEVKRVAFHLGMSYQQYYDKYLYLDDNGDIMNKKTPCQHLGKGNKCSVYEIRPSDCSGFPHTQYKEFYRYEHIHRQNIEYCPITMHVVSKMYEKITEKPLP